MLSMTKMSRPMKSERMITPIDSCRTCGQSGHVTFFISAMTSW
jgi:hypothetical protein